jgi:hypothetical protein
MGGMPLPLPFVDTATVTSSGGTTRPRRCPPDPPGSSRVPPHRTVQPCAKMTCRRWRPSWWKHFRRLQRELFAVRHQAGVRYCPGLDCDQAAFSVTDTGGGASGCVWATTRIMLGATVTTKPPPLSPNRCRPEQVWTKRSCATASCVCVSEVGWVGEPDGSGWSGANPAAGGRPRSLCGPLPALR